MRNTKGFTLIELLIVVAIIGVLAAVGIPMYNGYITDTKIAGAKKNFDTVITIVESEMVRCLAVGGVLNLLDKTGALKTVPCPDFGAAWPDANWRDGTGAKAIIDALKDHLEGIGMKNPYDTSKAVTVGNVHGAIQFSSIDYAVNFVMKYRDAEGATQKLEYIKYLKDWN